MSLARTIGEPGLRTMPLDPCHTYDSLVTTEPRPHGRSRYGRSIKDQMSDHRSSTPEAQVRSRHPDTRTTNTSSNELHIIDMFFVVEVIACDRGSRQVAATYVLDVDPDESAGRLLVDGPRP